MSYTLLAAVAVILTVTVDLWVLRTRLLRSRTFWASYVILLFFQLITNGVLTGLDIVRYRPAAILGTRLAYAPVEDLAFGFALITFTLCCWVRLTARARPGAVRARRPHRFPSRTPRGGSMNTGRNGEAV
jgi:lycopene cyclase domain-containing protein